MGGRAIAASIPLGVGFLSWECSALLNTVCFFGLIGVTGELAAAVTSAVKTVPCLVRFSAHVTRRNFGEAECSRTLFLDIAQDDKSGW